MTACSETLFRLKLVFRGKLWRSSRETDSAPRVMLCCCAKPLASWDCCGRGSLLHGLPAAGAHRALLGEDAGATRLRASAGVRIPERSRTAAPRCAFGGVGRKARSRSPSPGKVL